MYLDIPLPPGVFANGTPRQAKGRVRDASLMRCPEGDWQPVKGWSQRGSVALTGAPRCLIPWRQSTVNARWIGIGTHSKLCVQSTGGALSDITPVGFVAGQADATAGGGYGSGPYGVGTYGTPRPDTAAVVPASTWALDVWKENLIGCMSEDGKLYLWDLNTAHPAAQVTNSPAGCTFATVTAERFIVVGQGRTLAWCDQDEETVWAPGAANQAGAISLNTESTFRCARRVLGGHLYFTETDVWKGSYLGLPFVYGFEAVGEDCGVISMGSPVAVDSRCFWMGQRGFFAFNGAAVEPLYCEVADKVFSDFNTFQASKVTGFHNPLYGEVTWFYPSAAATENDSYVSFVYRGAQPHWLTGKLSRTCGAPSGVFRYPILADASGLVWEHENGFSWGGATPYLRTAPIEADGTDRRLQLNGLIGDERHQGDAEVSLYGREFPNGPETLVGSYTIGNAPTDLTATARQFEIQVSVTAAADARVGAFRLDAALAGRR
jgi:hypothetical protein